MVKPPDTNSPEISDEHEKLNMILKVLQDFGLNVIQNLGQLKKTLSQNTAQVEELTQAIIEVKSLGNRLGEVLKMKSDLQADVAELKALLKTYLQKGPAIHLPIDEEGAEEVTFKEPASKPEGILQNLLITIAQLSRGEDIFKEFQNAKEQIFRITGGHRILREMNETSKNLKNMAELTETEIEELEAKINDWIENL